jgi:hypothetical protein
MFGAARSGLAGSLPFKRLLFLEEILIQRRAIGFRDDFVQ